MILGHLNVIEAIMDEKYINIMSDEKEGDAKITLTDALDAANSAYEMELLVQEYNDRQDWAHIAKLSNRRIEGGRRGGQAAGDRNAERDRQIVAEFEQLGAIKPSVGARYQKLAELHGLSAERIKQIVRAASKKPG